MKRPREEHAVSLSRRTRGPQGLFSTFFRRPRKTPIREAVCAHPPWRGGGVRGAGWIVAIALAGHPRIPQISKRDREARTGATGGSGAQEGCGPSARHAGGTPALPGRPRMSGIGTVPVQAAEPGQPPSRPPPFQGGGEKTARPASPFGHRERFPTGGRLLPLSRGRSEDGVSNAVALAHALGDRVWKFREGLAMAGISPAPVAAASRPVHDGAGASEAGRGMEIELRGAAGPG